MDRMIKTAIGGLFLLSGSLLYLGVHIAAVLRLPEVNSWYTPPGRYGTALMDSGGYWMFWLAIVLIGIGLILLVAALFNRAGDKWRSDLNDIRRRSREFDVKRAESEYESEDEK
ncbi:HPP family protein [Saccharibacillus sacchari]|uniref:HPP family protein n=1 Tax=Saccharibacillus sacchari TaxID=456493 RepID=A0ACC6P9C8_9BACL